MHQHDQHPFQTRWAGDLDEGHQVHAFVFRLVEQLADPAAVAFHAPQGPQMLECAADHPRHGGDRFEHDGTMPVPPGEKDIGKETQKFHESEGGAIAKTRRRMMLLQCMVEGHRKFPMAGCRAR